MAAKNSISSSIFGFLLSPSMIQSLRMKQAHESDELDDKEIARRYQATLKSVLATPPQPKPKKAGDANPPKKRGRPAKRSEK